MNTVNSVPGTDSHSGMVERGKRGQAGAMLPALVAAGLYVEASIPMTDPSVQKYQK